MDGTVNHLEEILKLTVKLHDFVDLDSPESDLIRDQMDIHWDKLTDDQAQIVRRYSEMIYFLDGDCQHRHLLGRIQCQILFGNNDWIEKLTKMEDEIRDSLNKKCVSSNRLMNQLLERGCTRQNMHGSVSSLNCIELKCEEDALCPICWLKAKL